MGLSNLSAITISSNYPENILVSSYEENNSYGGLIYLTRDSAIHRLILSSQAIFESKVDAENKMKEICEQLSKNL